ncbi:MAG: hypothetical protein ACQEP5_00090 [Actinomycetota bacterium]
MKVDSNKVRVKIKTESFIVKGNVHTMAGARLSDYMTTHVNKFIPVTEAEVISIDPRIDEEAEKREVVFINVEKIEMIEYL